MSFNLSNRSVGIVYQLLHTHKLKTEKKKGLN